MGGSGSGFQGTRKATVEDGLTLSMKALLDKEAFQPGRLTAGTWSWLYPGSAPHASITYRADLRDSDHAWCELRYAVRGEPVTQHIGLTVTRPRFGGVRWWFLCPLPRKGGGEQRRAAKLHLPPGARYFGSREAYGLTYTSCRESGRLRALHNRLAADLDMDPASVRAALRGRGYE
jgi:hypothetical protein